MSYERPAKRIRQACEQCRRKKSKCSGERPVCSTCWRLEQQCFYHGEPLQPLYDYGVNGRSMTVLSDTSAATRIPLSPSDLVGLSTMANYTGAKRDRVIAW